MRWKKRAENRVYKSFTRNRITIVRDEREKAKKKESERAIAKVQTDSDSETVSKTADSECVVNALA